MTDFEVFQEMLKKNKDEFEVHDNGPTYSIVFPIHAGLFGSKESVGEVFFKKENGNFDGIHHCD